MSDGPEDQTPAPDDLAGTTILDRYAIVRKLGAGGMGSVYLARHVTLDKPVALKVLHVEFTRKPDLVDRFLQEARAASRIRHENVIDITDFGSTPDGTVFFAMEYLEGRDLHEDLARARFEGRTIPWPVSRAIFLQTCAALSAAHKHGIIHRDLKPENIFLIDWGGEKNFVKLLDFGIAKMTEVAEDGRKLTRTGMLFGTPEYMSPEQARGEKPDHRVDVYAMGCILFQLVTGRVPFEADSFMAILGLHLSEEPPEVSEELARVGAPPALAAVIRRALAKDRDQRYPSMDALAAAVREADAVIAAPVAAEASGAARRRKTAWTGSIRLPEESPSATEPVAAAARPRRLLWALAAGVALIAGGGVTLAVLPDSGVAATAASEPGGAGDDSATVALTIGSRPPGATVEDLATGAELGQTPVTVEVARSSEPRSYRLRLEGHALATVVLTPEQPQRRDIPLEPLAAAEPGPAPAPESAPESTHPSTEPAPAAQPARRRDAPRPEPAPAAPRPAAEPDPAPARPAPAEPRPAPEPEIRPGEVDIKRDFPFGDDR